VAVPARTPRRETPAHGTSRPLRPVREGPLQQVGRPFGKQAGAVRPGAAEVTGGTARPWAKGSVAAWPGGRTR